MYKTSLIGAKFSISHPMLGNPAGSIGYVFAEYEDFDGEGGSGIQIIFENGNYDGFSVEEQELFLDYVGYVPEYQSYEFTNVMELYRDFNAGYWKW